MGGKDKDVEVVPEDVMWACQELLKSCKERSYSKITIILEAGIITRYIDTVSRCPPRRTKNFQSLT